MKTGPRSAYFSIINEATGASQEDAAHVEEIMREDIFHSTLDWQTRDQLKEAAREAFALLPEYRKAGLIGPVAQKADGYTLDPVRHRFGCNVCDGRGIPLNTAGVCRECQEAR